MKKTMRYIGMAALALVGTVIMGCSENDLPENSPKGKAVTLTTTISLDGSSTRALDADGKKTFAKGDQIAVLYKDANDKSQKALTAALETTDISSDGKKAKITVTLENPKAGSQLRCIYPAAMLSEDFKPESSDIDDMNTINYPMLVNKQDGTLATISSNCDLAVYDGTFTSEAELPGAIALKNRLAILALTIKDYDGNDITGTITNLDIEQGPGKFGYNVPRTAAAGPIYVAMMPTEDAKEIITITATVGTDTYEKDVKDVTLKANNMYPVTVKTFKVVDLTKQSSDYVAQDGEMLKGTLGTNVQISIAAGATVTLKDVNINVNEDGTRKWTSGAWAGITCLGDATIILEGTNKVHGFASDYPGIQVAHNDSGEEFTLTINGDGSLEATGTYNGAGIGSASNAICGNITISGGTIATQGDNFGAGIGTGFRGQCGDITISGGSIEAKGNLGIGCTRDGSCGNITIIGGSIKAVSKNGNVGIGSGESISQNSVCGNITISGGTVTVTGIIGSGFGNNTFISKCGNITISGGTVTATSSSSRYCPGIGSSGNFTESLSECGDITITTDITMVVSTRGERAPFGIGKGYGSFSYCGKIKFGEATVYSGDNTSTNPVTSGSWSPNPMAIGNYGGLSFSISTKTNTDDTWTLSPT